MTGGLTRNARVHYGRISIAVEPKAQSPAPATKARSLHRPLAVGGISESRRNRPPRRIVRLKRAAGGWLGRKFAGTPTMPRAMDRSAIAACTGFPHLGPRQARACNGRGNNRSLTRQPTCQPSRNAAKTIFICRGKCNRNSGSPMRLNNARCSRRSAARSEPGGLAAFARASMTSRRESMPVESAATRRRLATEQCLAQRRRVIAEALIDQFRAEDCHRIRHRRARAGDDGDWSASARNISSARQRSRASKAPV